ncbi:radical SAM protein [Streptomyces sp. NPDC054796]
MHQLIAAPFLDEYFVLRPGSRRGLRIPARRFAELQRCAGAGEAVPTWLHRPAHQQWGIETAALAPPEAVLVRSPSRFAYGRASYELNLGCNFGCRHCYLGEKEFSGLPWPERARLLRLLRDAGVVWLQLTGGEPTIDPHFPQVYALAYDLGMMLEVLTNGSRLHDPALLTLLTERPPYRLTLSVYGAQEATFDGLTRRRGAWKSFRRGLEAAREAGLPVELSVVVTRENAHEAAEMHALARRYGARSREYSSISPTIYGGAETLLSQSAVRREKRAPFTGCDAGHTSLHVDPHGLASICKVARDKKVPLLDDGVDGLSRLGGIADGLLRRQGGCAGCALSGSCGTCMPLAALFRRSGAPLRAYCEHTEERT